MLRARDRDHHVGMLLVDLNGFREVNDTLGHRSGDEVLAVVAERLTDLARERRAGGPDRRRRVRRAAARTRSP